MEMTRVNRRGRNINDGEEKDDASDDDSDDDGNKGDEATQNTALLNLQKNTQPGTRKLANGLKGAEGGTGHSPYQTLKRLALGWNAFCFTWIIFAWQILCLPSEMCSEDTDPTVPDVKDAIISIAIIAEVIIVPLGFLATECESKFLLWIHFVLMFMGTFVIFGLMIRVLVITTPRASRNFVKDNWDKAMIIDEYAKVQIKAISWVDFIFQKKLGNW